MKWHLTGLAVFLFVIGGVRLADELSALIELPETPAGFANADGFRAEQRVHALGKAGSEADLDRLHEIVSARLVETPFDPVLIALRGVLVGSENVQLSSALLDQALVIAPNDRRVLGLRAAAQSRFQSDQQRSPQSAE